MRAGTPQPYPDGSRTWFVPGGAVVYDRRLQRVHPFDAKTAAVWASCDGQADVDAITHDLAAAFAMEPEQIADDVPGVHDVHNQLRITWRE